MDDKVDVEYRVYLSIPEIKNAKKWKFGEISKIFQYLHKNSRNNWNIVINMENSPIVKSGKIYLDEKNFIDCDEKIKEEEIEGEKILFFEAEQFWSVEDLIEELRELSKIVPEHIFIIDKIIEYFYTIERTYIKNDETQEAKTHINFSLPNF